MAAKARQQYYADGEYIDKQAREFQPTMEFKTKIDSIEPGAQVNIIEDIKVNGTSLEVDDKTVDISIPLVIDNLYSTDGVNALSAKQGKVLYDLVQNLASRGRYLSNWNAATGLPTTNPVESHYQYRAGDYYVVSNVAAQGGTNYRPEPGEFVIGQASVTVETEVVKVTDMYLYDGTNWNLLINSTREIPIDSSLSTSSTNPVENRVVTNAINGKQDTLVAGSNIQIASDGKTISATDTTYTAGTNVSIDANNQISAVDTTYTAGANVQISNQNVISATDTTYSAGTNVQINNNVISATDTTYTAQDFDIKDLSDSTDKRTYRDNKQEKIIAGNNVTIGADGKTINATDTTYTAGTGIDITNGVISNTQTSAEWGNITGTLSNQTDLQSALDDKQDTLTAGDGIDIDGSNNISVDVTDIIGTGLSEDANNNIIVDTTVVATQTDLSGKQDKATSGSGAPSTTPTYVGQQYVDTTNDKLYVATGTSSSSDWSEVGSGSGDMLYSDFNWVTKTGATITLDLRSEITPSTDFTVNKPSTLEDGQYYILRVTSGATAYTMTLGTNVTNPYSESLTLEASTIQQFTFLAKGGNLELQPSSEIDISGKQDKATSGSTVPSTTPSYVGQQYIDTTNDVLYVATGTTSSSDWTIAGKTYSAGDGIDIVNDEISVDTDVIQEKLTAGTGIEITGGTVCTQESDRKGPAPSGFHVPKKDEWQGLQTIMNGLSLTTGDNWRINLHIPFAGRRDSSSADVGRQGLDGYYWSSTPASSSNLYVRYLLLVSSSVDLNGIDNRAKGYSVRCFKNSFEVPTASWTVITGTLGSAGIFWNQTEGLISITSNGTTGYTIQDKNIGATAVYNDGDTLTQANMGNFYQWGNNYGFPSTGYISNISYTQVDTSNYGPTNPYSSDTFITGSGDWSSVRNDDLWGNTSNSTHEECVESPLIISADTTVLATKTDLSDLNTKTFYLSNINDLTTATAALQWHFSGKNAIIVYSGYAYTIGTSSSSSPLVFISTIARSPDSSLTKNWIKNLQIFFDSSHNATVIHDSTKLNEQGFLETDYNYSTPYIPTYAGSPATKKYVDDNVVQKSATAPSSPTEGMVWYDTTNDVLKAYDGTNWNVVGNGDMAYADFNWVTKTGATVTLDFNSVIEPSANFTVNAPSTIKDGQIYILRVESGATAYTMTLGTGITNPYSESTTLTANKIKLFTFLAIDGDLELQPSVQGGGIISSNNTYEDIVYLSQSDYDALVTKDPNTLYSTPEQGEGSGYLVQSEQQSGDKVITAGSDILQPRLVYLTRTEYENLPSSKLTDGIDYVIIKE